MYLFWDSWGYKPAGQAQKWLNNQRHAHGSHYRLISIDDSSSFILVCVCVFFYCFVRIFETISCSFSSLSLEELHHIIWSWYSNLSISVLSLGHRRSPSESELKSRHWIHRFGTEGGSISCSIAVPGIAIRTVPQRQLLTVDGWNPAPVGRIPAMILYAYCTSYLNIYIYICPRWFQPPWILLCSYPDIPGAE